MHSALVASRLQRHSERKWEAGAGRRDRKVYSIHAPEVGCIGKGKAHKPYEVSVKVSGRPSSARRWGGHFVPAVRALPGSPYNGRAIIWKAA
jgi:IS5 family transposase